MGITKNRLTEEKIKELCGNAFPEKKIDNIKELVEGMCNAAYDIGFCDGVHYILKVSPANDDGLMTNEVNLMDAEVSAMRILSGNPAVIVPEVIFYDNTKECLESNYFFMTKMEGHNWFGIRGDYSEAENEFLCEEVGRLQKALSEIKGSHFGMLGDSKEFSDLYSFMHYLVGNVLGDIEQRNIPIGVSAKEILKKLEKDKIYFEGITNSTLVHWDMWEGNIFVKDHHITGVIDWERAMWGEPYMDDRFRHHSRSESFLKGFGIQKFTEAEKMRIRWYDIYLYLIMMAEVTYRQYEDDGQYQWVRPMFDEAWKDVAMQ